MPYFRQQATRLYIIRIQIFIHHALATSYLNHFAARDGKGSISDQWI
jgi:hypothetical protein